ncbi:MAG: hypothetical protein LBT38_03400, partial [Deltaproteobacteria bacterium]|jgi:hypothetical protein|nr:hypothetical protein [Deltaproteobacteria bacterium]
LSETDSDPGRGQTLTSSVSEINPDSTLIDQGLPTLTPPNIGSTQIGHFIGEFSLLSPFISSNEIIFSVDMQTGRIFNAGFNIVYEGLSSTKPEVATFGGEGYVNNLAFTINNFTYAIFDDDSNNSLAPSGFLGSGTSVSGSLSGSGAMHFGQTASGVINLDYGAAPVVNLQPNYSFIGDLVPIPLLQVEGVFDLSGISSNINQNYFDFQLDLNKSVNNIKETYIEIDYIAGADSYRYNFEGGAGTLSGNTFNISFPTTAHGTVLANVGGTPYSIPTTGSLNGQLASANPSIGTQVVPGSGGLSIATIPPGAANSIPLGSGDVVAAGP